METELDQIVSCNCSFCSKQGWLIQFAKGEAFKLLSGRENLTEYRFNTKHIEHVFCKTCGIESFAKGKSPDGSDSIAINVRCLDDVDVKTLPIIEFNGKAL